MISDTETKGGAAIAASHLAEALITNGHEITRIIGIKNIDENSNHPWKSKYVNSFPFEKIVLRGIEIPSKVLSNVISTALQKLHLDKLLNELQPDIINIHNIHGTKWSPEIVQTCEKHAPVVWTLHDMWSFTGRCAYNNNCRKFISGCDSTCPTPNEYPALSPNLIERSWKIRKKMFSDCENLTAVCPSEWLANEAKKGLWRDHQVEIIPNGLPLKVFKSVEKQTARAELKIESKSPIILAAAQNINEKRKGGPILAAALEKVTTEPLTVLTFGSGKLEIKNKNVNIKNLGFITELEKILAYNAADLFVHPALEDNLPNVVMESIACGTPVIGFTIGGVPDMVRPDITGWLINEINSAKLAEMITNSLDIINNEGGLGHSCRRIAENEYSSELQASRYISLFKSMIN